MNNIDHLAAAQYSDPGIQVDADTWMHISSVHIQMVSVAHQDMCAATPQTLQSNNQANMTKSFKCPLGFKTLHIHRWLSWACTAVHHQGAIEMFQHYL